MSSFVKRAAAALAALVLVPVLSISSAVTASAGGVPLPTYRIINQDNPTVCLDIPHGSTDNHKAVQIYTCNGGLNQQWQYVNEPNVPVLGKSYGYLINVASGKCADVKQASLTPGAAVEQYTCFPGTRNQLWTYDIISQTFRVLHSDQCLVARVPGSKVDLMQYPCDSVYSKRWVML
ncbi:RICIN domain-containing protein [Actinokineospora inagensis]|uniref:RICIN domain-containing protein n=1 Tax=Actinokineospora inagensis TaxID=103730 RepID=UPI0003F9A669|nr:RICIN domain-containing protein [Actinokineospora inagensis]